jgi:NNP family nitrate/nitrite transporter-like MFS transporter
VATSDLDIAVAEVLTWSSAMRVFTSSGTWLCALAYMTTFGFELAVDSNLPNALFNSHRSDPSFGQETAGYCI